MIRHLTTSLCVFYVLQGSGWSPPTPDYITRATFVTAQGTIEDMDRSHPDFAVLVMSVGMVGILLDVTVKVGPSRHHPPRRNQFPWTRSAFQRRGLPTEHPQRPHQIHIFSHANLLLVCGFDG